MSAPLSPPPVAAGPATLRAEGGHSGLQKLFAASSAHRSLAANGSIFRQGEGPAGAFLVLRGAVTLYVAREGQGVVVGHAGPGDFLGLSAALCGQPHAVSALAAEPCELAFIAREPLLDHLRRHPSAAMEVLKLVSGELAEVYRRLSQLLATGRKARLLP